MWRNATQLNKKEIEKAILFELGEMEWNVKINLKKFDVLKVSTKVKELNIKIYLIWLNADYNHNLIVGMLPKKDEGNKSWKDEKL